MPPTHKCDPIVKQLHPDPVSLDPVSLTPFPLPNQNNYVYKVLHDEFEGHATVTE